MNEKEKEINVTVLGEGSKRTLLASREPLDLVLLASVNALVDPKLIKQLVSWLNSVTLEEAAEKLETSTTWCFNLKKELEGMEGEKDEKSIHSIER